MKDKNTNRNHQREVKKQNHKMEWKEFYIKKRSGGKRLITAPNEELKEKQKQILKELYEIYHNDFPSAFGGLPKKNIKQLAEKHVGKEIIIRLDIKNFFDNINKHILIGKLEHDFKKKKVENKDILLDEIKKYCFYKDKIPQGAITSPLLSNIYLKAFDVVTSIVMKRGYYTYSRYFDDLTFSLNNKERIIDSLENENNIAKPLQIRQIIRMVETFLEKVELKLNYDKIKIMKKGQRQAVCNVTVNEKVNIDRKYYRWLRAIKHHFDNNKETTIGEEQYLGHLAFVQSINPEKMEKLKMIERR